MNSTVHRSIQRLVAVPVLVALLAIVAAWLAAGSASAAPRVILWEDTTIGPEAPLPEPQPEPEPKPEPKQPGPGDLKNPEPEAGLAIKVQPECERTPGIRYEIIPLNQPEALSDYRALWSPTGGGPLNVHAGQSGFIASGEGQFTVSGHAVRGEKKYDSAKVDVTVKCDDPGKRRTPDPDKPRPGTPNFTG